jgi:hypothetical protein
MIDRSSRGDLAFVLIPCVNINNLL